MFFLSFSFGHHQLLLLFFFQRLGFCINPFIFWGRTLLLLINFCLFWPKRCQAVFSPVTRSIVYTYYTVQTLFSLRLFIAAKSKFIRTFTKPKGGGVVRTIPFPSTFTSVYGPQFPSTNFCPQFPSTAIATPRYSFITCACACTNELKMIHAVTNNLW